MENKNLKDLNFSASYTSISKYVDQLYNGFVPSVVGKIRTLDYVTLVPDVKYQKVIPTVKSTFDFVAADSCSTFANGATTSVVGVTLTSVYLKAEESLCLSEMEQYYFGQYMKRGSDQEAVPFEQAFMDEKMNQIAKKIDTIYWNGGSGVTGLIATATASGATVQTSTASTSYAISTSITNGIIATLDGMIDALSADLLDEEDLTIFVGRDIFNRYTISLRNLNLYWANPNEIQNGVVGIFGRSNVKLVATVGLNGVTRAILAKGSWLYFGCDLAPAEEAMKGEYNMYLDKYLIRYKFKLAPALAFPNLAVVSVGN